MNENQIIINLKIQKSKQKIFNNSGYAVVPTNNLSMELDFAKNIDF